jgi:hypothetical protein
VSGASMPASSPCDDAQPTTIIQAASAARTEGL